MRIKVINFDYNKKQMHMRVDAELGDTVNHLRKKYGDIHIHSVYPEDGPMIKFTPPATPEEFVSDNRFCCISVLTFVFCFVVVYVLVQEGVFKKY